MGIRPAAYHYVSGDLLRLHRERIPEAPQQGAQENKCLEVFRNDGVH